MTRLRISHSLAKRYLRTLGLWVGVASLGATGIYLLSNTGALSSQSHSSAYRDITWEDLLEHRPPPPAPAKPGQMPMSLGPDPWANLSDQVESAIGKSTAQPVSSGANRRQELDGVDVRLAGYIVPLQDAPDHAVTEFFLVPYVGACIHVPPPPPDQIIYIRFPQGLRIENIYEAFRVQGTLHLQTLHTGLADTAYMMVADEVTHYDPQASQ